MVELMVRSGVSHFLQVVIMVALVTTLGLMMYGGALQLFSGWGSYKQVIVKNVYEIGNNLVIVLENKGSSEVIVIEVDIYKNSNTPITSWNGSISIIPGESTQVTLLNTGNLKPGDIVEIVITLSDNSLFKYRVSVE